MSSSSHSGRPGVASATSSFSSTSSTGFSSSPAPSDWSQSDIGSSDHAAATLQRPGTTASSPSSSQAHVMGHNQSKASLVQPSPSPKQAGFSLAAPTGSKLKRAFAARRKKSEDITAGGQSQPAPRQRGPRQLTLQVAQAFSGKKPKDGLSPVAPTPPPKPASIQAGKRPIPPPPPIPTTPPANRGSIMPITPGVSSAVNFMIKQEELSAALEREKEQEPEREREKDKDKDQDADKSHSKEAWRRSDATITQRPGAASATRASRPVSTAESLQSTHTVVPVNKRLSALVTDADFGMPEEDEGKPSTHQSSPTASVRSNKPRSMSLNVGPSQPFNQTAPLVSPKLSSETAPPMSPSASIRETPTLTRTAANGIIAPSSSGLQSTGNNIRGRLAAWTATSNSAHSTSMPRPETQALAAHAQSRQPAVSLTAGFSPAAGFAKRAVEKMGRAWGGFSSASKESGYSSSSSTSTAPSSYSSADHGLVRTNSHSGSSGKASKHRRTPNAPSSNWSISSSNHSSSISDADAFVAPVGPSLGKRLRGPLKVTATGSNAGSVVFGCRLKVIVSETSVTAGGRRGRDIESAEKQGAAGLPLLRQLERRMLPALVVRCAQHILIWGVQEEGLFRVTGRPSHISKLRSEFDSGADWDMSECTPGDLDPHAVASVFKAFLRELPEPILTQGLIPYFEAALNQESSLHEQDKGPRVRGPTGPSLPSGPKSGAPPMRKPPSLSTLAMPNFNSIRPPSQSLINALKSLIAQLPPENRDLIRTVTELIRATAKQSRETKMPLSNLLLVFCPSLNMNPPLLRVLCEAEGIWGDEEAASEPEAVQIPEVVDIKRQTRQTVLDIRAPEPLKHVSDAESESAASRPQPDPVPSPAESLRPRSPGARSHRMHPAAMYMAREDSTDESSLSQASSMLAEDAVQTNTQSDDVSSVSTSEDTSMELRLDAPSPLLSSSAESLATPSSGPSLEHLPLDGKGCEDNSLMMDDSPDPQFNRPSPRPTISPPIGPPVQFPTISGNSPVTPLASTRPIPTLSLPSLSLASFSPKPDSNSPGGSAPSSPIRRLKKPSLHLLFSKRSASPLTPSSGGGLPFISGPYLQPAKAASDTSLSTPVTAVTAPEGSPSHFLPVLDTPIESSSLRLALGIEDSPDRSPEEQRHPAPAADLDPSDPDSESAESDLPLPVPGQTPIADWYRAPSSSSLAVNHLRPHPTRKISKASIASTASSNRLGILDPDENEEDWTQSVLLAADLDWTKQGP
ncbi:Rho-GAP domain-containing protein [Mycena sanguinolenta]|uniref:Rho-GAP domain-containing protein n=1 Tax=Mycena sanguinolenta TaxID=230812 RepID=A0A8H6ZBX7_9AGAR|nr:Rho-GAP domain-containing protein [Mycena sanguinolenta]